MGVEIERKFLVLNNDWRTLGTPVNYAQGYLTADGIRTVRIRIAGEEGFITIKGGSNGISRLEFEYPIPVLDALEMLRLCAIPVIQKFRTKIDYKGKIWEIDEFEGDNKGLILAEIELTSEDESFDIPTWIGQEVTGDLRYFNSQLSVRPFRSW
ncbi:MAG: CYTH domain-containing protein [Mariniphaga sp.]